MVQAHRTSSNLLEPHHYRDSKVFRVLSHEFGVVRLYRTFSIYIVTEIARCAGCLCTCSGWFKHKTASDNKTCKHSFVYAYNLLVLGLNRGSPARQKKKQSFTYGTLNRGSPSVVRLLLLCRHILYGTFHHGSTFCSFTLYISYGTVNYALCDLYNTMCYLL